MKKLITLLVIVPVLFAFSGKDRKEDKKEKQEMRAFRVFEKSGKPVDFNQAAGILFQSDIVFFGEYHNNPVSHWLQLRLVKLAYELKKDKLFLGAEMFESDGQLIMNEYLNGTINDKAFEEEMRLWPNYKTDYKPLVQFARENRLVFVCSNIPRRYANMVYKGGLETLSTLSDEAKKYMAPLPIEYDGEVACYKKMLEMSGGHGGDNLPKAQAVKDATMAWFMNKYFGAGMLGIHFNGSYHSDNDEGIQYYLKKYNAGIKLSSITTVSQDQLDSLITENKGLADFTIAVAEDMTTTH